MLALDPDTPIGDDCAQQLTAYLKMVMPSAIAFCRQLIRECMPSAVSERHGMTIKQIAGTMLAVGIVVQRVEQGVDDLAEIDGAWPSAGLGHWEQWLKQPPLLIGQVGCIGFAVHPQAYRAPFSHTF